MSRVCVVVGDYYHCSDQLLAALSSIPFAAGDAVTTVRYPDSPAAGDLAGYDLLILAMMGRLRPRDSSEHWFDEASQQALADRVAAGAGLLLFHSGTASHPESGPLRDLAGGRFVEHPPEHPVVSVDPVVAHPITSGVTAFAHPDEHYFMETDDGVTHLLCTRSSLGEQSGGWCKRHGSGRVAAIVPGHTREMLEDPMLHVLLANAAKWCLGGAGS